MNTNDELNWQAMQYVLDEMSPTDREAFEEQLLTDLAACEAVAAATRLRVGLKLALAQLVAVNPKLPARSFRSRSTLAAIVVCVASIVFAVGFLRESTVSDPAAVELVANWRAGMQSTDDDDGNSDEELAESDLCLDVPEWLVVALEARVSSTEVKDN